MNLQNQKHKALIPVTEQQWPIDEQIVVSVSCAAYNHEPFIRDCIEGFLMQRTSSPIEILIHDDASTDGTAAIIAEYAAKYPCKLPRYYDSSKEYPVMYVLDGSSHDKHVAHKLDILSTAGYVPETILVGLPNVSGIGWQRDYTPPFMRMDIDEIDSPLGKGDHFYRL